MPSDLRFCLSEPASPPGAPIVPRDSVSPARAYTEHLPAMRRAARSLVRKEADAEDLVHDVFIEAFQKWRGYDAERGSVRTWLLVRLRSRGIDWLRRQGREVDEREAPELKESPDLFRAVQGDRAWRMLEALSLPMRQVVTLRFGEGLSITETAARMGLPTGTVKSRQSHAVRLLRAALERDA